MWTSDRGRKRPVKEALADVGRVTVAGEQVGVYLEGERRWGQVFGPGGYSWRPALGEQVLVLKAGGEGEEPCIVGCKQEKKLSPGEVEIQCANGSAAIRFHKDGELELSGNVTVGGTALEDLIEKVLHKLGY